MRFYASKKPVLTLVTPQVRSAETQSDDSERFSCLYCYAAWDGADGELKERGRELTTPLLKGYVICLLHQLESNRELEPNVHGLSLLTTRSKSG